jgi:hypothetical protein
VWGVRGILKRSEAVLTLGLASLAASGGQCRICRLHRGAVLTAERAPLCVHGPGLLDAVRAGVRQLPTWHILRATCPVLYPACRALRVRLLFSRALPRSVAAPMRYGSRM